MCLKTYISNVTIFFEGIKQTLLLILLSIKTAKHGLGQFFFLVRGFFYEITFFAFRLQDREN